MKVGFIGAGKVGTAMGRYLKSKGVTVIGYYSRSFSSAQYAASKTDTQIFDDLETLVESSNFIFLTTPDDVIESVSSALSKLPVLWDSRIVCHMSGVYASDILLPLKQKDATVCSLHPLLSFAELESSVKALAAAPFTLEGSGAKMEDVRHLLNQCSNHYTEIAGSDKSLYHAAACVLSNYMVTLLDMGMEMFRSAGFAPHSIAQLTEPLITKTMTNIINMGTKDALTGPISRGDSGTVEQHLSRLQHNKQWLQVYKILGIQTLDFALREGRIDKTTALKMKEVFNNYE